MVPQLQYRGLVGRCVCSLQNELFRANYRVRKLSRPMTQRHLSFKGIEFPDYCHKCFERTLSTLAAHCEKESFQ
jgi:hypothetical protein